MPALDIYGADKRLIIRLGGTDVFKFREHLPAGVDKGYPEGGSRRLKRRTRETSPRPRATLAPQRNLPPASSARACRGLSSTKRTG